MRTDFWPDELRFPETLFFSNPSNSLNLLLYYINVCVSFQSPIIHHYDAQPLLSIKFIHIRVEEHWRFVDLHYHGILRWPFMPNRA
jgi:hypothetical protein